MDPAKAGGPAFAQANPPSAGVLQGGGDHLPTEFVFDDRNGLLNAIGFGYAVKRQSEEYRRRDVAAQELGLTGFAAATELANALRGKGLDPIQGAALIRQLDLRPEHPVDPVINPARRRSGILEHRENALHREAVRRERSIQPGIQGVVAESKAYLRAKYTNAHGQMVCQVCQKVMPLKLAGQYYFEAVQVLRGLSQHYYENRLALCPTCAAMYKVARAATDDDLRALISATASNNAGVLVPLILAGEQRYVHFVGTHLFDLKIVIGEGASKS